MWQLPELGNNSDDTALLTLRDYVRWAATRFIEADLFFGHGSDNPFDEAATLLFHLLHIPHERSETYLDCRLTTVERQVIAETVALRISKRLPAAYLTHEAWFAGYSFYVDERVLIPRSPIAELIEAGFAPWLEPDRIHKILDLCTGSGCIAIAAALHLEEVTVDAVDISPQALAVAEKNRLRYELTRRVNLIESDLFNKLTGRRYDLIVSNPPYVDQLEMQILPHEYRHEPRIALEAGKDGLDIVRIIVANAAGYLNPKGVLIVEVGNSVAQFGTAFPDLPVIWLEFERGGEGVFLITREQLIASQYSHIKS
ncbi:MAG: 50S ribosomal protein L3 N(5)-glutamine methyltransferase [Gammaproteobacteria bacterium]|nr:50S ribosomal protein L3 N(5)-glutamine methyltransferase [Gammaproteobacteria bacterium]